MCAFTAHTIVSIDYKSSNAFSVFKMIELIHNILTLYALPGLILGIGFCFLFVMIPDKEGLNGYKMARRMMGYSYLICFLFLVIEGISLSLAASSVLQQIIMITIGIFQAFLFTFALTTLIDVYFFTWRRFIREVIIILLPTLAAFMVLFICSNHYGFIAFLLLALFYLIKLVCYIVNFRNRYHDYERNISNYFSDDEHHRLEWVKKSFFTALTIGLLAFYHSLFPSLATSLIFTIVMGVYYTVFGIRFINYAFTFYQIETVMVDSAADDNEWKEMPVIASEGVVGHQAPKDGDKLLMDRLSSLMEEQRLYIKSDITIEEVALLTGVSYRSVSAAINRCKGVTFKSWINSYRIEESIRLIKNGYLKNQTIEALSQTVGFANRISFYRVFKSITGHSPTDY